VKEKKDFVRLVIIKSYALKYLNQKFKKIFAFLSHHLAGDLGVGQPRWPPNLPSSHCRIFVPENHVFFVHFTESVSWLSNERLI
jgi:hypothetical protein